MKKLSIKQLCEFDTSDAFSEMDFNTLLKENLPKPIPPPLFMLLQGDTGSGKTSICTKTLHPDMLPALYLYSFKEEHNFNFPKGVSPLCFEMSKDGSKIQDPEECYNRLLRILHSPAVTRFKTIILDSIDLDDLILQHSLVLDATKYQDSSNAKELYWTIIKKLKELNKMGTHIIVTMGLLIDTETGKALPLLRGKSGAAIPTWFGDRLVVKMMEDPATGLIQPLFATKTLVEKVTSSISNISETIGGKTQIQSVKVTNTSRPRLRDLDTKPLDLKPALISRVWEYIVKVYQKTR